MFDKIVGDGMNIIKKWLPEGWRYQLIGYVALFTGVAGAVIAWFGKGPALDSLNVGMGLPMLMAPYIVVPRVKIHRLGQGFVAGVLSGMIALVALLIFATAKYEPILKGMGLMFAEFALGSLVTAWLSSKLSRWTDKYTAKKEAEKSEKHKQDLVAQYKDRYRMDQSGNYVRIHRKRRKKR